MIDRLLLIIAVLLLCFLFVGCVAEQSGSGGAEIIDTQHTPDSMPTTGGAGAPETSTGEIVAEYDQNGDGMLSMGEAPSDLLSKFTRLDTNGDGLLTEQEIELGSSQPVSGTGSAGVFYRQTEGDATDPENCTGFSATAEPAEQGKVDIIWVIDASLSMMDEQIDIQNNLSQFVDNIGNASIDYHVVIITNIDLVPPETPLAASGNYLFIPALVQSTDSLNYLVNLYQQYEHFLRADAATHFIVVTDDESSYFGMTPADRAQAFNRDMQNLLGKSFFAHAIASESVNGLPCTGDPDSCIVPGLPIPLICGASKPGATYYELADLTNALKVSVCTDDWSEIFDPLTEAVIESVPLPCNYPIPAPPQDEELDPNKVNVQFISLAGQETLFPKADNAGVCKDSLAWYYDNAEQPAQVMLCPVACDSISEGGTFNVTFGCQTVVLLE